MSENREFGMIFLPSQKLSSIVQYEHNLRWMTWYQPSLSYLRCYLLSGITVYIPYNVTVCLFQMPMSAPRQPSVTSSMATVPIPLVPIFVPAKLVSLEMVGPVLVRWIQIRFCKNNHISRMHLTWIEKHALGHFPVPKILTFTKRLNAKPFLQKYILFGEE